MKEGKNGCLIGYKETVKRKELLERRGDRRRRTRVSCVVDE